MCTQLPAELMQFLENIEQSLARGFFKIFPLCHDLPDGKDEDCFSLVLFFFFSSLFFPLLFAHRYSLSIFVALVIQPCSCKGSARMWRRHWNSWRKGAELRTAWGVAGAGALQACTLGLPSSMIIFWLKFTCWAKPRYFTELCKGGWGIPGHSLPGQPAGPLQ